MPPPNRMSCRQGETRSKKDNKSESIANTNQTTTTTTTAAAPNKAALIKREARSCPALAKSRIPVYNNNHHHLNPHRQSRCSTPKCPPSPFRCASSAGFCTATATTSAAAAAVAAATFLPALPDHIKALHKIHNINQHTSEQRFIQRYGLCSIIPFFSLLPAKLIEFAFPLTCIKRADLLHINTYLKLENLPRCLLRRQARAGRPRRPIGIDQIRKPPPMDSSSSSSRTSAMTTAGAAIERSCTMQSICLCAKFKRDWPKAKLSR